MVGSWSALSVCPQQRAAPQTYQLLVVPVELWQDWFSRSPELATWLEAHPQREDLYAALRPFGDRPRQERTFLDESTSSIHLELCS